ncbi:hypothetical protein [Acinetobacter gyllenbergii]|uniref:hypothetical protein n=1 Tax=Acinetobacter gyllenbergii TaxID=134534 RepID=UPI003F54F096
MTIENAGNFELDYNLIKKGGDGSDFQIGMDFTISNTRNPNDPLFAICQMIYPMTAVGNNTAHIWNIDNHATGDQIIDLAYKTQSGTPIVDTPRELIKFSSISSEEFFHDETRFCAFILDINNGSIYKNGVTYGYKFSGHDGKGELEQLNFKEYTLTPEQFEILHNRVDFLRII